MTVSTESELLRMFQIQPLTCAELAKYARVTRATAHKYVKRLEGAGYLRAAGTATRAGERGPRPRLWKRTRKSARQAVRS